MNQDSSHNKLRTNVARSSISLEHAQYGVRQCLSGPRKTHISVPAVQLKLIAKAHISVIMLSGGISIVGICTTSSEKTRLKKITMVMMMNKS